MYIKPKRMIFLFLILVIALPHAIGTSLLLSSFESSGEFQGWESTESIIELERSTNYASTGQYSLQVSIDNTNKNAWPNFQWPWWGGLPTDWSGFTTLAFDYYNPTNQDVPVYFKIQSAGGNREDGAYLLKPGKGTIVYDLLNKGLDLSKVNLLQFFFWNQNIGDNCTFYVDNIRLVLGPRAPKDYKAERLPNTSYTKISWGKPDEPYADEKAVSYRIYRGDSPVDSSLTMVADVSETFWIDESTEFDQSYFYKIIGVDSHGREGIPSEIFAVNKLGILNSFESSGEFQGWESTKGIIELERSTDYASAGQYSLEVSIDNSDKDAWPNFQWPWWGGLPTDWSGFNVLAFDYYNPTNQAVPVYFKIQSAGGTCQTDGTVPLNPGKGTIEFDLLNKGLDLSKVNLLHFFFWNQNIGDNCTFYVDNIRLIESEPPLSPSNLKAQRVNGTPELTISWDASGKAADGDLAMKYRIYSSEHEEFEPKTFLAEVDAKTLQRVITDVPAGRMFYAVSSVDKMGNESVIQKTEVGAVGKIGGRVINTDLTTVTIFVPELDRDFRVNASLEFTVDFLLPGFYSILVKGEGYRIKKIENLEVVAGEKLLLGDISLEKDNILPNTPRNLEADSSIYFGLVSLKWDEPEISEGENELDTEVYNIYRSTNNEVKASSENFVGSTQNTFWIDKFDESFFGKTVYYTIEAVDGAENRSKVTSNVAATTVEAPPVPSAIAPIARDLIKDDIVKLEWNHPENDALCGFIIEISQDNTFPQAKIKSHNIDSDKRDYVLEETLSQGTWYWRVRAVSEYEIQSVVYRVNSTWSEVCEFVVSSLIDNPHLTPYINVYPKIMEEQSVRINYLLTDNAKVTLRIFNLAGKQVASIVTGEVQTPDEYSYVWSGIGGDGKELYNGLYFVQLIAEPLSQDGKKVILQRKLVINR